MSKARDLERIISDALGTDDPISDASIAADVIEAESGTDYTKLSAAEARQKAADLLVAARALKNGYLALCACVVRAPVSVAKSRASQNARKKAERDPKAQAKAEALALWKERHAGKHPKLRTVEMFATEVMRRWPVLTSPKVICGWSAEWTKSVKAGRTPVC